MCVGGQKRENAIDKIWAQWQQQQDIMIYTLKTSAAAATEDHVWHTDANLRSQAVVCIIGCAYGYRITKAKVCVINSLSVWAETVKWILGSLPSRLYIWWMNTEWR